MTGFQSWTQETAHVHHGVDVCVQSLTDLKVGALVNLAFVWFEVLDVVDKHRNVIIAAFLLDSLAQFLIGMPVSGVVEIKVDRLNILAEL